jgi:nucleotide-binding universal stress UspA family protein
MNKFIVPTDFSDTALQALRFAGALSQRCGAQVHILHAYILLENIFTEGKTMRDAWNQQHQEENIARLLQVKQYMREHFPNVYVETHLFTGPTEEAIIQFAEKQSADMIIMGTQGASGLAKVLVGSVTADMIAKSPVPVLAVPANNNDEPPGHMLLAIRDFDEDETCVRPVFFLASLWDVPVHVMVFVDADDVDDDLEETYQRLESYVERLQKKYPLTHIVGEVIEGEDFSVTIEDFADENGNGLLCMITHHRGLLDSIFHPSMTREMAYHTRMPLLAIPSVRN